MAKLYEMVCRICGAHFQGRYNATTCSPECAAIRREKRKAAQNARERALYRDQHPVKPVECLWCGITIWTAKTNKRFCSPPCRRAYNRALASVSAEDQNEQRSKVASEERMQAAKEFKSMQDAHVRCGRPEFLLLDGTMYKLAETGQSYADYQKQKTLSRMKPIDVAAFMAELKRAEREKQ